jgi:hypothetical protein
MPSENSFHDRYGRAFRLKEAINLMPEYQPTETSILATEFDNFLISIAEMNNEVGRYQEEYNTAVTERRQLFFSAEGLRKRASAINDYCKSLSGIKSTLPTIQRLISKINNTRRPASSKKPLGEDERRRNSGEQSFAELTQYMGELIAVLNKIDGVYKPNNQLLTLQNLSDFLDSVKQKNKAVAEKEYSLSKLSKERNNLYEGEAGLKERMKAIRAYIRADYGRNSPEYLSIKELSY